MNAIIYARFSPRKNADTCESCETQIQQCREYCAKKGYAITSEYEDRALSGADEDRPGLWAAISALGKGDALIVYRRDRLARDVYLSEYVYREAANKGAAIESATEGANGDTPEQKMIRQVLQAFAEYERKIIAARTRAAMLLHQKNGRRMSARPPWGTQADGKRLIRNPAEEKSAECIRKLRARGLSYRKIIAELSATGHAPRGKKWHPSTIKKILERGETQ